MRIESKKKLALLVSMALTVGSTLAVNPMDVYAATGVTCGMQPAVSIR